MGTKKVFARVFLSCLLCLTICGCGPLIKELENPGWRQKEAKRQESVKVYFAQNPDLANDLKNCIWNKQIRMGMTKEQVLLSWGKPCQYGKCINKTVGFWGVHEQWVYNGYRGPYLYFENGVLTSWQD